MQGDSGLIPENIRKGITLFGIEGILDDATWKSGTFTFAEYQGARSITINHNLGHIPTRLIFCISDISTTTQKGLLYAGLTSASSNYMTAIIGGSSKPQYEELTLSKDTSKVVIASSSNVIYEARTYFWFAK